MSLSQDTLAAIEAATEAGASGALVRFLATETETETRYVRGKVESHLFTTEKKVSDVPKIGGHFINHLWHGRIEKAWNRADGRNQKIMAEAGLKP